MSESTTLQLPMFSAEDSHVRMSAWPETARDWLDSEAAYGMSSIELLQNFRRDSLSSKTSLDFSPPIKGETLQSSLAALPESYRTFLLAAGKMQASPEATPISTVSHGGCWTLSISESPNDAVECLLWQVLEREVAPKYYLSKEGAAGILRRAERRGKTLPPLLESALKNVILAVTVTTPKASKLPESLQPVERLPQRYSLLPALSRRSVRMWRKPAKRLKKLAS